MNSLSSHHDVKGDTEESASFIQHKYHNWITYTHQINSSFFVQDSKNRSASDNK